MASAVVLTVAVIVELVPDGAAIGLGSGRAAWAFGGLLGDRVRVRVTGAIPLGAEITPVHAPPKFEQFVEGDNGVRTDTTIENLLAVAASQGAWGGKACGAGGGGCLAMLCPPERKAAVEAALTEAGSRVLAARPTGRPLEIAA